MWDSLEGCKDTMAPDSARVFGQGLLHQHAQDYHVLLARDMGSGGHLGLTAGEDAPHGLDKLLVIQDKTP